MSNEELVTTLGNSGMQVLRGEVIWDVGNIFDGDEAVTTCTVEGANLGDFVLVSSSLDVVDLALVGQVTAANTVTVQFGNWTGGTLDVGTPTVKCMVITAR